MGENIYTTTKFNILHECNGCSVCKFICPKNAINFFKDKYGFNFPKIKNNLCINCGLCVKKCPVVNCSFVNDPKPKCYAFQANDDIRIEHSSSGGIFAVLCDYFISHNDYVCGAAFDDDFNLKHYLTNNKDMCIRMRGSKYLQSDINDIYLQISEKLKNGFRVLFTGTPCQVAGLRSYLDDDYNNLFCVDLVCHGVPSQDIFHKYLSDEDINGKVKHFNFRDKSHSGWNNFCFNISLDDGTRIVREFNNDPYGSLFNNNVILRNSCYNCVFQRIPRQGDITIGDFWGFSEYHQDLDDDLGTSLLLVNNKKGKYLYNILKCNNKLLIKERLSNAINRNVNIFRSSYKHNNRDNAFFDLLNQKDFSEVNNKYIKGHCDVILQNFWYAKNYGAILTSFALYEILDELGYDTRVLNYIPSHWKCIYKGSFSQRFAEKHFKFTPDCETYEDLIGLNNLCDTFIVGSDQVWKYDVYSDHDGNIFQLNFTKPEKRRVACSVSLGSDVLDMPDNEKYYFESLIKDFNSISVREPSGKKLLLDNFNIDSDVLVDPVFAYSQNNWRKLAGTKPLKDGKYYVTFTLSGGWDDKNPGWFNDVNNIIRKKSNIDNHRIQFSDDYSVEDFLNYLCYSEFIVTDSFHVACFSVIFNKPLLFLLYRKDLYTRLENIINRYKVDVAVISEDDFRSKSVNIPNPDFTYANTKINKDSIFLREWLLKAVQKDIKDVDTSKRMFLSKYGELQFLRKENSQLHLKNDDLEKYVRSLINSNSWLITKPVRFLSRLIKR